MMGPFYWPCIWIKKKKRGNFKLLPFSFTIPFLEFRLYFIFISDTFYYILDIFFFINFIYLFTEFFITTFFEPLLPFFSHSFINQSINLFL